jgi:hypothetical protein
MSRNAKLQDAEKKLAEAQDRARRRALGPPLALSGPALAQAAAIGPLDLAAAQAFWRRHARPGVKRLIEAGTDV